MSRAQSRADFVGQKLIIIIYVDVLTSSSTPTDAIEIPLQSDGDVENLVFVFQMIYL